MTKKATILILVLAAAVAVTAYAKKDKPKSDPAPAAASAGNGDSKSAGDGTVAATVAGAEITMADLDKAASNQLSKIRQQEFDVRSQVLTGLIQDKLIAKEAAARGVTAEQLET